VPRTLVRAPGHDRLRSLGGLACAWIEHFVRHGPGAVQGMEVALNDEYAAFVMDCYALLPEGKRIYDHVFLSRPKGTNKSGLASYIAMFEGLGPARYAGLAEEGDFYEDPWGLGFRYNYEPGEPMGKPVHVPMIRIMATEEGQTGNIYDTIYYNLVDDDCPLSHVPGIDPGRTRVYLPSGGFVMPSTASSAAKDGGKETFVCFDESHLYNTPELRRMYTTVTRNLVKLRGTASEPWFIETTTMFAPGEDSVAETTFREAEQVRLDKKKRGRQRMLYDHRWGECPDLTNEEQLVEAIKEAFGEAIEWNDIPSILDEFYSLKADPADSRRYFLNAETSSSDTWLPLRDIDACKDATKSLQPGDVITLGFDGSINDDSTALVACRVSDGHLELLHIDERPVDLPPHKEWSVDEIAVDAAVHVAFKTYRVVGFYCDPAMWSSWIAQWHTRYEKQLKARATAGKPLEFRANIRTRMAAAVEAFYLAVRSTAKAVAEGTAELRQISIVPPEDRPDDGKNLALILRRHLANCYVRKTTEGDLLRKELPKSPRKIDAAMSAVLAFQARNDAIKAGVKTGPRAKRIPRRVR
jgi:hypothetical protein